MLYVHCRCSTDTANTTGSPAWVEMVKEFEHLTCGPGLA